MVVTISALANSATVIVTVAGVGVVGVYGGEVMAANAADSVPCWWLVSMTLVLVFRGSTWEIIMLSGAWWLNGKLFTWFDTKL